MKYSIDASQEYIFRLQLTIVDSRAQSFTKVKGYHDAGTHFIFSLSYNELV